jgi:cardiolipin synthase
MTSVLGTILDPAADKALVGTLVVALTMQGLLPCESFVLEKELHSHAELSPIGHHYCWPGSVIVFVCILHSIHVASASGRQTTVRLCLTLNTLKKTFRRYWDFSIPSAEVHPTVISKVNTAFQLLLLGSTTISPLLPGAAVGLGLFLKGLQ